MSLLDISPESNPFSSIEHLLMRRKDAIETSKNAVEGVYVQLYKAGAFLAEKANNETLATSEYQPVPTEEDNDSAQTNVLSFAEAKKKQEQLENDSRRDAEIARRLQETQLKREA